MKGKQGQFYYGWVIVAAGFLVMALLYSLISCQGVYVKPMAAELGVGRSALSVRSLFAAAGSIFGAAVAGTLLKRFGIKAVMMTGTAVLCLSLVGTSFSTEMWQLFLCSGVMGICFATSTIIPVTILINSWFGVRKKGLANSIALAGSGIGGMIMTVILSAIVQAAGWRVANQVSALIIALLVLPVLFFAIVPTPALKNLARLGDDENVKQTSGEKTGLTMKEAKGTGAYWLVLLSFFLISLVNAGILNHQLSYFSDIGFSATASANFAAIAVGSLSLGKIIFGALCDKLGLKKGALIGNITFLLAMVCLLLLTQVTAAIYFYVLCFCIGGSIGTVGVPLFVAALFGEKAYGDFIGIINVVTGIGNAVGALIWGSIFDVTGSYQMAWILAVLSSVVILLMQWICFSRKKRNLNATITLAAN